jgi:Type II secretion system (T2SS), protein E, N-terminal domain
MGKLGQLLVARGWITVQQLTRALQNQNAVGGRLGTCLLEMEVLSEELLARALSELLGVPAAVVEDLRGIPDEVLRLIPEKLARRCRAIPFRVAGGRVDVAMQDPRNLVCQDEVAFACGRRVKVHVLHEVRVYEALQRYYREECPSRYGILLDRLNRARYMWGARDGGARPPPGTPEAQVAQRAAGAPPPPRTTGASAPDAYGAEDRTEVLSALPSDGLLAEPPRWQPPPLPEPPLPPLPRLRSLFRSRGAERPPPPPAAEGAQLTPRVAAERQLVPAPPASTTPAAAVDAAPLPAGIAGGASAPAGAAPAPAGDAPVPAGEAPAPAAASVAAAPEAGPAGTLPALDLEATLTLGPPAAAGQRRPATVAAPPETAASRHEPAAVPHETVAVTPSERAELGLGEGPAATPPESPREAPATLEDVEAALAATSDSEEVGRLVLGFLARSFRRVALFQVARDQVTAWMAHGDGIDQEAFARYAVSFKEPSVFLNLRQGSSIHIGPLPPMTTHRELALCWGGGLPRDCLVLPVRLKDRLVTVIYTDGGGRGLGGIDLEQMHRLTAATAAAFERCILSKKRGYAQS